MMRFFDAALIVIGLAVSAATGRAQTAEDQSPAAASVETRNRVEEKFDVVDVKVIGIDRTDPHWIRSYMDLEVPVQMTQADVGALVRKLKTTGAFTQVKAQLEAERSNPAKFVLYVQVEEKWTLIPVVRGVYGGGTPLRIFGLYDIHSFGKLLTLGAESRQYGDAPPGFVIFARDPRSHAGRYYLGADFWRDFRRRQLYARDGEVLGSVSTNAAIARLRFLTPLAVGTEGSKDYRWKYGAEAEFIQEAPSVFDAEEQQSPAPPDDLNFAEGKRRQAKVLPTLLYDDVDVDVIEYDGLRLKARFGPTLAEDKIHGTSEAEFFDFHVLPYDLNLAFHGFVGQTSFSSLQTQYFLGGLDSIRGLPDGAIYGTHAGYVNTELRHLTARMKYLWIQTVVFADAGGAGPAWDDVAQNGRSSAGIGLRFAVPQVYRLVFRLDYAWSMDGSHTQGITAGMNQFFDPYTPL